MKKKLVMMLLVMTMGVIGLSGCREKDNAGDQTEDSAEEEEQSGIVFQDEATVTVDIQEDDE